VLGRGRSRLGRRRRAGSGLFPLGLRGFGGDLRGLGRIVTGGLGHDAARAEEGENGESARQPGGETPGGPTAERGRGRQGSGAHVCSWCGTDRTGPDRESTAWSAVHASTMRSRGDIREGVSAIRGLIVTIGGAMERAPLQWWYPGMG